MRLESTGRLGAKDHSAALWEINNRRARAETGAQLKVLTIQMRMILDVGGCSGVAEISSGFRCILKVEPQDFIAR